MFMMRLYASYAQSKPILAFIIVMYGVQVVIGITTAAITVASLKFEEQSPDSPLTGCIVTNPGHKGLFITGWTLALCAATIYFVLILFKFMHNIALTRKSARSNAVPIQDLRSVSPLIYSFVRDSAGYFFMVFAGHLMNLIFEIVYSDRALIGIGPISLSAIYAVAASRLCLSTRESLQSRRFECETGWFEEFELSDTYNTPVARGCDSPLFAGGQGLNRSGPTIVIQDCGKVSLQRSTFESDSPRGVDLGERDKRSQHSVDDEELMSVAPWIILERPISK
ncbi:hypothetical protein C8Q80DRAFT_502068 [Daedaleopsis nitida]|nr:hypothetical protein C8Q80DRAFT_502068 [Daedaleopsis nitida]